MTFIVEQCRYTHPLFTSIELYTPENNLVIRRGVEFFCKHAFRIPYPVAHNHFRYYKLLYWSGSYLLEQIEAGMICRDDTAFQLRWHGSLTHKQVKANPNAQYAISFRAANGYYHIDPVVLISIAAK